MINLPLREIEKVLPFQLLSLLLDSHLVIYLAHAQTHIYMNTYLDTHTHMQTHNV